MPAGEGREPCKPAGWERAYQVALVEQEEQVLVARICAQVPLQVQAARALWVPCVQHLHACQSSAQIAVQRSDVWQQLNHCKEDNDQAMQLKAPG